MALPRFEFIKGGTQYQVEIDVEQGFINISNAGNVVEINPASMLENDWHSYDDCNHDECYSSDSVDEAKTDGRNEINSAVESELDSIIDDLGKDEPDLENIIKELKNLARKCASDEL